MYVTGKTAWDSTRLPGAHLHVEKLACLLDGQEWSDPKKLTHTT